MKNVIDWKAFYSLKNLNISLFYLLLFISLFGLYFYFAIEVDSGAISLFFKLCTAIAESAFWMIFICLIKFKWRYIYLTIPFAVSIFLWINLLYFRNFNDLIPASSYFHSQISNENVIHSAFYSIQLKDTILFFLPFIPLIFCFFTKKSYISIRQRRLFSCSFLAVFIISYGLSWAGAYRRIGIYTNTSQINDVLENLYPENTNNWRFFYDQHTFHGYALKCLLSGSGKHIKLSAQDIDLIRNTLFNKVTTLNSENIIPDSLNLIMIVVESLPVKALEYPDLYKVAPTLCDIINDTITIKAKALVLTEKGRSSDAQFMFNTGLLPLRQEPLVTNYSLKPYPSLAKALGVQSLEIIGEDKALWSHGATSISYGFDELISSVAIKPFNQDCIIFKTASEYADKLPQPFFLFISTISMHDPYNVSRVSSSLDLQNIDPRDLEYFNRLNHFDNSLRKFIENLKASNRFDNSVIIIVGDHDIHPSQVSEALYDNYVPLLIINSPLNSSPEWKKITQLDLFPSVLDIFNIQYQYIDTPYRGLGKSIFTNDSSYEKLPDDIDYKVSELIITRDL